MNFLAKNELLLLAGFLFSLLYVFVAAKECLGSVDVLCALSLAKLCAFFLHCKGYLHGRTTELRYSLFVVVFEILSVVYLKRVALFPLSVATTSVLIWINAFLLLLLLVNIIHALRALPWRAYKRLLSGELDMLSYHIRLSASSLLFILQYALVIHLISTNKIYTKAITGALLLMVSLDAQYRNIAVMTSLVSFFTFKDILLSHNLSTIGVFVAAVPATVFLLIDVHLQWIHPKLAPRRVSLE
ncbi:hypothetical protein NEDG_00652 [Nematocida displodere]|uniref:Alpha-1,3-mannosyltransferase n=1 Tax=Nematocida displodere TaxID=1805483 RepID=A0A177EEV1_9MICR|nr:hypothetical protein NEDG_00652 [Nematocida displodere]